MHGLLTSYPCDPGWQRDLSVADEKVGDVLIAQGNLSEALKFYPDASLLPIVWPRPAPAMSSGKAISLSVSSS
jgi:hypothetical protein